MTYATDIVQSVCDAWVEAIPRCRGLLTPEAHTKLRYALADAVRPYYNSGDIADTEVEFRPDLGDNTIQVRVEFTSTMADDSHSRRYVMTLDSGDPPKMTLSGFLCISRYSLAAILSSIRCK